MGVPRVPKHTSSHDRALEWETPTKELGVGQSGNGAHGTFASIVTLSGYLDEVASHLVVASFLARKSNACDGGGEGSQDREEGENPHIGEESVRVGK